MNQTVNAMPNAHLMELVQADELKWQKYWDVLKRRWFSVALVTGTVFGLTTVYTFRKTPTFVATGKLLFKADKKPELVGIKTNSEPLRSLTQKSDPLTTQAEILRSQQVVRSTINRLQLTDKQGEPLDETAFLQRLRVRAIAGTDILEISYRADSAKQAAAVVNHLMRTYLRQNVQSNQSEAATAREFIVKQLPDSERAVEKAEAKLRDFKEKNGVIVLDQESSSAVDSISKLDQQITQTKGQLAQASSRVGELASQVRVGPRAGLTLNALNQSEGVQKALATLQETQSQLAKERSRFQTKHPAIDALKRQESEARAVLQERVREVAGDTSDVPTGRLQIGKTAQDQIALLAQTEVERISLEAQVRSLINARNQYADRARKLPELEKTQRELERQLEAAQTTYKTLLTKLQEVQVAVNQAVGNAEIVATAEVPKRPASPNIWLNLLAGSALGLCLGVAIAFLLDARDRSVRSLSDASELFDYSLLGVIPKVEPSTDGQYSDAGLFNDSFPAQEAYQMLHTNLKFVVSDKSLRSIVVTSSVRREGKSTVAANLAVAMAQVQRRVLLIDADFRNPCQHHVWDLLNRGGLSNVLVGQLSLNDAIQTVMPKLHVLTAGSIPPNPIALLDSRRMAELVKHLRDRYDVILFDSPALGGTADATILNKLTDGSLLVVRPDVLTVESAKTAKQFLTQSNQTVLGMVMNAVDAKLEPQGMFYHPERQPEFATSR